MSKSIRRQRSALVSAAIVAVALGLVSAIALGPSASALDTSPTPVRDINGAATQLDYVLDIAVAPNGTLWVLSDASLLGYASGATGNVAPTYVISGDATGLTSPYGIAVDASGNVWVADEATNSLREFAAGSTGDVAPISTVSGDSTQIYHPSDIAIGPDGSIYVANNGADVLVFAGNASGDTPPKRLISGNRTGFSTGNVWGLDVNATGLLAVTVSDGSLEEFASGAVGNVAPTRTITGSRTHLDTHLGRVALDAGGKAYSPNAVESSFSTFAAGASGNAIPAFHVSGPATNLADVVAITVDNSGKVYVAQFDGTTAGVSILVFDPITSVVGLAIASVSPVSGPPSGGNPVTIHGYNFLPGATVTFDGVAARNVIVTSPTMISATVPPHRTGNVDVTVSQSTSDCACDRQVSTLSDGYAYASILATTGVDASGALDAGLALVALGALGALVAAVRRWRRTAV